MKYIARKGIVLTCVGGQQILVSAVFLRGIVPYVMGINDTTAVCWERLVQGTTEEELVDHICEEFETDDIDLVRSDIHHLIAELHEKGYITEESI